MEASRRALVQDALTRLSDGDREAFTPLFNALWPLLLAFASRYLPRGLAEDVAQQSLLNLFARADEFDSSRDAVSFAIGIAFHEMRTARRKAWRRREDPLPEQPIPDVRASPLDEIERKETDALVEWGLARLSIEEQNTLQAFVSGSPESKLSPTAFRKRVQRAKERLRAILKVPH
ncbi:MAG: sigma-70 family RNA polymerase sigma factor [Vicinamibacteria bacterium]